MTDSKAAAPNAEAIEKAWAEYHAYIETTRRKLLDRPEMQNPQMRAMAQYAIASLQAGGFQFYIAPRQQLPMFYRDAVWSPVFAWGGPSSDMVYRWCFLDGSRTYRITGRRGTVRFTDLHLFDSYWGAESMRDLGNFDLNAFTADADGNFEIIASPDQQPGNWLPLDRSVSNVAIQMRETWWDWGGERATEIHIEAIDERDDTMLLDEADFHRRLHLAGRLVEQGILRSLGYGKFVRKLAGGDNKFSMVVGAESDARQYGASPRAGYVCACWNLQPDEALIIDSEVPRAKYWSLQLMSPFWDTLDFNRHQSGLNGHQMQIDADNRFRCVLSFDDPGVPNWLDPLQLPQGQCLFRWYDGTPFELPRAQVVKLRDIRNHLPAATPQVTPAQRKASLRQRARDSLRRWGY
jgi:hypothetical protein